MSTQAVKAEIINNVMVAMSYYIQQQTILSMLEQVMQPELVRVNMEAITTLPAGHMGRCVPVAFVIS